MNPSQSSLKVSRPWFREPWPWILFGLPGLVVIASFVTLAIAVLNSDALVQDDYYKEGLTINKTIARAERALALGVRGHLRIESGGVFVLLESKDGAESPDSLVLRFTHPTRARSDMEIKLFRSETGYRGVMHPLEPGRWQVHLEDTNKTWRVSAEVRLPSDEVFDLVSELEKRH